MNPPINKHRLLLAGLVAAATMGLTACGSDDKDSPAAAGATLSGTAATGAPLIGQVTVKDANGVMRTTDLRLDGTYTVDVAGLTAPFLLRAQGNVGGREVRLVSAATEADVNGNINITPFTDLIIANIAGQVADAFFDNPSSRSGLTPQGIDIARQNLTNRLLPIMLELGVDTSFDLMRTYFSANHTGFDAVMDVVKVTVDPDTAVAEIRDIVNNKSISDNLADPADATVIDAPAPGSLDSALTDIEQVRAQLKKLGQVLTSTPINETSLRALFVTSGYLAEGRDLDTEINDIMLEDHSGWTLVNVTLLERVSDSRLYVLVEDKGPNWVDSWDTYFDLDNGVWKMAGDRRPIDSSLSAVNDRHWNSFTDNWSYGRYLDLWVGYAPSSVDALKVTGPGLPVGGVWQTRSIALDAFPIDGQMGGSWLPDCSETDSSTCIDFSVVPNDAVYTVAFYDVTHTTPVTANGATSYTKTLPRVPYTNAEAAAAGDAWFGRMTSVSPSYDSWTDGTNISFAVTAPTASGFYFDEIYVTTDVVGIWSEMLTNGVARATWSGATPSQPPSVGLWINGPLGRDMHTNWNEILGVPAT